MISDSNAAPPAAPKALSCRVVGIGGAGCRVLDQLAQGGLHPANFVGVHSNHRELAESTAENKVLLGAKLMRGLGSGGDPDLGRAAAEEEADRLRELCQGVDLVFLVAGLGGGTASGAAPVLAGAARESGALVLAVVTLPFEFEGARRQRQAHSGLQLLKNAADGVICLPNQKILKLIDENTTALDTFRTSNELLRQNIRAIWQMLTRPGLMNVDFADLCAVLRGRHAESAFATARAEGEARARDVIGQILSHPLLEEGRALADADSLLVSLVGGPDLTMTDVQRVMEQLNRLAENAQVMMGAAIAEDFQGQLEMTLVATRRGQPAADRSSTEVTRTAAAPSASLEEKSALTCDFFVNRPLARPAPRFVPPPPELSTEEKEQLFAQQNQGNGRARGQRLRWLQGQLPLDIISKGRFEKSEPTIHHGEDLDVPTYIRRGVALN